MGGFFGAVSKRDVVMDVFFGVDYHSHLGTRRAGMIVLDHEDGYQRQHPLYREHAVPHAIRGRPACASTARAASAASSDTDPQPLLVRSHLGTFAITTVGAINNAEALGGRVFRRITTRSLWRIELGRGELNRAGGGAHQPEG